MSIPSLKTSGDKVLHSLTASWGGDRRVSKMYEEPPRSKYFHFVTTRESNLKNESPFSNFR